MEFFIALFGGLNQANLVVSCVALIWTLAAYRHLPDRYTWVGWSVFWASCVAYYWLAQLNLHETWLPWLGLYPGTIGLLVAYVFSEPRIARRRIQLTAASGLLVVAAAGVDIHVVRAGGIGNWHQVLTAVAVGIWAWRLHQVYLVSSIVVATYATVQLPLQSIMSSLPISESARAAFLDATKVSYLLLKLPLLVAIYPLFKHTRHVDAALPVVPVEAHDVFVSYARPDETRAAALVDALRKARLSVWWDRMIPPGHSWRGTIGNALETARCVVVLWSGQSVKSRYVLEEGASAYARSRMISVTIEAADIPFGFKEAQAVEMTATANADDLNRLVAEIRRISSNSSLEAPKPGRRNSDETARATPS